MNKITYLLIVFFVIISCSDNDKKVANLVNNKVEIMSGHEIVADLLIENDGNEEQLARIFKCSVPTIQRILNKETYLTNNALSEFRNLLVAVKVSGKDTFKENDPYYKSWIRAFKYWLDSYVLWAITAAILFFIIGLLGGKLGLAGIIDTGIVIVFVGGYILTWILNMLFPYVPSANLFLEKINPLFETLI